MIEKALNSSKMLYSSLESMFCRKQLDNKDFSWPLYF